MENQKPLQASTLIGQFSDAIQYQVNDLFSNSIMATGIIVGGIFFAGDQLLWMEQLTISSSADFVHYGWL